MVVELRRYLGDTLSVRIHDADRERRDCRLSEIRSDHRRWYDSLDEALADLAYEPCPWCLGEPGRSAGDATATVTD